MVQRRRRFAIDQMEHRQDPAQIAQSRIGAAIGGQPVVKGDRCDLIASLGPRRRRLKQRQRAIAGACLLGQSGESIGRRGTLAFSRQNQGSRKLGAMRLRLAVLIVAPNNKSANRHQQRGGAGDYMLAVSPPQLEHPLALDFFVDFAKDVWFGQSENLVWVKMALTITEPRDSWHKKRRGLQAGPAAGASAISPNQSRAYWKQLDRNQLRHLIEQPMLGACRAGPRPVAVMARIATNSSRGAPGLGVLPTTS